MRIFSLKKNRIKGFTLLELSISLFILTLLVGFSMPRMSSLFRTPLEKEARRLASLITDLKNQSLLKRESYTIIFDPQHSKYTVYTLDIDDPEKHVPHEKYKDPVKLTPPVTFKNISENVPDTNSSKFGFKTLKFDNIFDQKFTVKIDSTGFIDLFKVELQTKENMISITIKNVMGEIEIGNIKPL